ncbi:MAG: head-tail connector protein [Romboutsia sp.]
MDEQEILDELTLYGRIDEGIEEVKSLKLSAEEYLKNAGIYINYESSLYFLAVKMLSKHWYDNRDILVKKDIEIPYGITCIINQLQIWNIGVKNEVK